MEVLKLRQDYDYFSAVWEHKKSGGVKHTSEAWDGRADDWGKELSQDGPFRKSLEDRVNKVAEYLRAHGLLDAESQVLDIGCGPGRFVTEFAKTADHVTGVDLSQKMLDLGADYADQCDIHNVSFLAGDFSDFNIEELGWEEKFDLVFTSITPAIGTMANLEKLMRISRGYCFNSCFVRWDDELERQISEKVFHREYAPSLGDHGHWYYALFNLLWLKGYFPETYYHRQSQSEYVEADENLARYYARSFSENLTANDEQVQKVLEYLKGHANSDGRILREYERWYGWLLWDVRLRATRLKEK